MDFKIDFGPWQTVFSGKFLNYEAEIKTNPEKYYLNIIYEKNESGEKIGALFQGYKSMVAKGNLDSFVTTIPKPMLGITKSNGEKTNKMIFMSFQPVYVDFKEEDYIRKIDNSIKKSYEEINNIIELARSSGLTLKDVSLSSKEDYEPILSDPLAARVLMSGLRKSSLELVNLPSSKKDTGEIKLRPIGLNKKREIIRESSENIYRSNVTSENQNDINYSIYILVENLLLDHNSILIFDEDNYFNGLSAASKNEKQLREELVDFEPAGFPTKKFTAKKDLFVSLKYCDVDILLDLINTKDEELKKALKDFSFSNNTIKEEIEKIEENASINDFKKLKIKRLLNIIDKEIGSIFGETIEVGELIKKWSSNLGKANIINLNSLTELEKIIFVNTMLNYIESTFDGNNDTIIVLPNIGQIINAEKQKTINYISDLSTKGVGFIFGSNKNIDELNEIAKTKIKVVNGRDVAMATLENRNYRVILRPTISGEAKI